MMTTNQEYIKELENKLTIANEKLKLAEDKLDAMKDLVYKTFNGDGAAATELSNIVGVPAPILYCDDDDKPPDQQKLNNSNNDNHRFRNRLAFLDQVMSDHDKLMSHGRVRQASGARVRAADRHDRARSADRMPTGVDRSYFNPYTWSLNEHTNMNMDAMYRHPIPPSGASCTGKRLFNKSSGSHSRQSNNHDIKVDDVLHHSSNRRPLKSMNRGDKSNSLINDFKLMPETDTTVSKPPKAIRSTSSSLSFHRNSSAKGRPKNKITSPYNSLALQSMSESDSRAEELLKAMEKRFELSTIDLQRRLGISQAGMVGP